MMKKIYAVHVDDLGNAYADIFQPESHGGWCEGVCGPLPKEGPLSLAALYEMSQDALMDLLASLKYEDGHKLDWWVEDGQTQCGYTGLGNISESEEDTYITPEEEQAVLSERRGLVPSGESEYVAVYDPSWKSVWEETVNG